MDLKNLLSSLGALSNFISNQNQQPQNQQSQNQQSNNFEGQNFCYYPQDFSNQEQNKNTIQNQNNNQTNFSQQSSTPQRNEQNLNFNFSQFLPLLSLIFGKNQNLSALSSSDNGISKLGQILGLLSKQEEKPKLPSIDSYKKIE